MGILLKLFRFGNVVSEWEKKSIEDQYLSHLSNWQIWNDHKFCIFQSWNAKSLQAELESIRKMGSLVATNMSRQTKMQFSAALLDVAKAFGRTKQPIYDEAPLTYITKKFCFWEDAKGIEFHNWTSELYNVLVKAIEKNPVLETALASTSNNNDCDPPSKQMETMKGMCNKLLTLFFLSNNEKVPPTHKGLSNGRATLLHLMRYCIWSRRALEELKNNCVSVDPLNQRSSSNNQPWLRIHSLSYFRLVICRVHVKFIDHLKECLKNECRVLQTIRKPKNLADFGATVIVPALEAKTDDGYIIPMSQFAKDKSSPKGQALCNRIVFAGGHEFMVDLLETRVSHGMDPCFRSPEKEHVNLYLKYYLGYVENAFLYVYVFVFIFFSEYHVTYNLAKYTIQILQQGRRCFHDAFRQYKWSRQRRT